MPGMRRGFLIIVAVLTAICVGCGGGSEEPEFTVFTLPIKGAAPDRPEDTLRPAPNGLVGPEPRPVIPDTPPPQGLYGQNFIDGIGSRASFRTRLSLELVGFDYATRKKFYSSWDQGQPLTVTLGRGELVEGLEHGIVGMEVGDLREIVVPARLTKGADRLWGAPANSALVFVVGLLDVKDPQDGV
jgi:hypothetical protein